MLENSLNITTNEELKNQPDRTEISLNNGQNESKNDSDKVQNNEEQIIPPATIQNISTDEELMSVNETIRDASLQEDFEESALNLDDENFKLAESIYNKMDFSDLNSLNLTPFNKLMDLSSHYFEKAAARLFGAPSLNKLASCLNMAVSSISNWRANKNIMDATKIKLRTLIKQEIKRQKQEHSDVANALDSVAIVPVNAQNPHLSKLSNDESKVAAKNPNKTSDLQAQNANFSLEMLNQAARPTRLNASAVIKNEAILVPVLGENFSIYIDSRLAASVPTERLKAAVVADNSAYACVGDMVLLDATGAKFMGDGAYVFNIFGSFVVRQLRLSLERAGLEVLEGEKAIRVSESILSGMVGKVVVCIKRM